jgi:hypothetical protein
LAARGALLHRCLAPRRAPQRAAAALCSRHGQAAPPSRAGAAVPLAAAAGPGAPAQGRQAAPRRLALKQFPALAALAACPAPRGRPAGAAHSTAERGAARLSLVLDRRRRMG